MKEWVNVVHLGNYSMQFKKGEKIKLWEMWQPRPLFNNWMNFKTSSLPTTAHHYEYNTQYIDCHCLVKHRWIRSFDFHTLGLKNEASLAHFQAFWEAGQTHHALLVSLGNQKWFRSSDRHHPKNSTWNILLLTSLTDPPTSSKKTKMGFKSTYQIQCLG